MRDAKYRDLVDLCRYFIHSASFSVGGLGYFTKGYIVGGYSAPNLLGDLWQYDPLTNTWTQKAGLPGGGGHRQAATPHRQEL